MQRIIVVEDHPMLANAIAATLRTSGFEVDVLGTGSQLRTELNSSAKRPSLIILDLALPDVEGVNLIKEIHTAGSKPNIPILVFTGRDDPLTVVACANAGASGFVKKSTDVTALMNAIEEVLAGRCAFEPSVTAAQEQLKQLPASHLDVLRMLAEGQENKEIASNLGLAPGSVKNIVTALFQQFGVASRQQLRNHLQKLGYRAPNGFK